ncbi:hypothetical protein L7F22_045234 [Adiantum nelumboides]|nr:hypothetical protein [Adiantum nelumboides]
MIGLSGFRMASLEKKTCRRLAILIALWLLFSLVPVAGSRMAAIEVKGRETLSKPLQTRLHNPLLNQASSRNSKADAAKKAVISVAGIISSDLSEAVRMAEVDDLQGVGRECVRNCGVIGPASIMSDKLLQAKREKGIQSLISGGYMILKRRLESLAKEKTKGRHSVSHGVIRVKPIEHFEPAGEKHRLVGFADHRESKSGQNAGLALHSLATESQHSDKGRSPKHKGSLIGLGVTKEKEQIQKVVQTLRQSGLFAAIAGVIEAMNLWMLPQLVTIFIPTDSAYLTVKEPDLDPLPLYQYHIVIQRYAFNQLCEFNEGSVLYTLRPGYTVMVTAKQSPYKITLDDVAVIAPDLYLDETIAVHGIDGIFNATLYGKSVNGHVPALPAPPPVSNATSSNGPGTPSPAQAQVPDSNISTSSVPGAAQPGLPSQQGVNSGGGNTNPNSPQFPFSPLASETASDVDGADQTVPAGFAASYSAAFVCVFSFLCC